MQTRPDPTPVTDLIESFRRSKTMFTAVELGIFDFLYGLPQTAGQLAHTTGAQTESLERLLDACCALGLLTKTAGAYANTAVADAYLRKDSPDALTGYILYSNRVLYPMWGNLRDAVVEGKHRWAQTFGTEGPIFSHFFRNADAMRTFLQGMHGFGQISSPEVVRIFNLRRFATIADLGGATGHLAIAACERYGHLNGIVFDLPAVIEHARPFVAASSAASRIRLETGDFFTDPLPPADLYAVGRILHDWSESKIRTLLGKIFAALPSGGALLIAETLLDDDATGPLRALMQSLNMLVMTEGKERTEAQYQRLLEEAGFHQVEARRTGTPLDAILALKP